MSTNLVDASAASAPRASTSNKPRNQGHRDDSRQKAPPKVVKASTAGQGSKDGAGSRPSHRGDSSVSGERSTPAAPPQSADRLEERKKRAPKAEDQGAPSRKGQPSSDQPESRGSSRPRERGLNEGKQAEREKAPSRESDSTKERSRLGDRPRETGGGPSGNRSDSHARRPDDARSHTTDRSREPSRNSDRDRSKFGDRDSSHRPSSDPARAHTSPSEGSAARPANDKRKISDRLGEPVPPKEWHKKPKHR
ncbi:uncharacterized protein BJ171DRAFT_28682 [Polychytrium aggregatum]|uniref:uncharacterized protein n=1 Tax=Polychytrium aggregatum TaxID=110093 RepID=UPI0022FE9872|nr:uncharacterized protein BJ171DRAFT_28682 [Polychytrium aggregatum]KAI9206340.1 hypothetical protein BJ171DRAFT_28682 [Polychytrium aggregatum]